MQFPPWTSIDDAARLLADGQVVAIPTETVYGLAGNAYLPSALAQIFAIKERPTFDPLIVHICEIAQLADVAENIPDAAYALVKQTSVASRKQADDAVLDWQYQAHTQLGKKNFPSQMQIQVNLPKKPVKALINLSNVKADDGWETRTEVNNKRYKEVTLEEVMERLMKL